MSNSTSVVDPADYQALKNNLDQFFLIIMGMVVFLMQCGFGFLEAGAVRSKNTTNILLKNFCDSFVAGISYWLVGYPFAFGTGNAFLGYTNFASYAFSDGNFAFFFFQFVFAATAATIVSGAMAERCEIIAYFTYSIVLTGCMYPIVTHWAWSSQGWLAVGKLYVFDGKTVQVNYMDFAGSGVVHILGGVSAFFGALLLGPRKGRFHRPSATVVDIRGHSVPLAALGGFILLFGFLAFNGGSQLEISSPHSGEAVALSVVNTFLSGSTSAFVTLFTNRILGKKWSLLSTINGALTGMVAACAGCNAIYPWSAIIIGAIASLFYMGISKVMTKIYVDDPLDAVAVHFGGGMWGVLAIAFLKKNDGILFAWNRQSGMMLAWQVVGAVSIAAWTAALSLLMFGILKLLGKLRVPEDIEMNGLDIPKHGEPAYPWESYGHGWTEKTYQLSTKGELYELEHHGSNPTFQGSNPAFQTTDEYSSTQVSVDGPDAGNAKLSKYKNIGNMVPNRKSNSVSITSM